MGPALSGAVILKEIQSGFLRAAGAALLLLPLAVLPSHWLRALGIAWSAEALLTMRVILGGIGSAGAAVLILGYHRRKAKKIADLKGEVSRLGEEKRVLAAEVEKLSALAAESQKQKRPVKAASGVAMGSAPILEALSVTGKLSIEEAAVITGMPQSEIEFLHLEHLVEEGFAEDVWDGGRVMRITKPGRIALEKHRKDQEWLA